MLGLGVGVEGLGLCKRGIRDRVEDKGGPCLQFQGEIYTHSELLRQQPPD